MGGRAEEGDGEQAEEEGVNGLRRRKRRDAPSASI